MAVPCATRASGQGTLDFLWLSMNATRQKLLSGRKIGKTRLEVSALGLGCASLGNLYRPITDAQAKKTARFALKSGLRYVDTAPYYGFGLSERRVGDVLRQERRDSFVLSTKVGRLLRPCASVDENTARYGFCSPMAFEPMYDYSYDGVMRSYEDSLQRLGLNRIDILYIHDVGRVTHGDDSVRSFKIAMDGGYKALDELRQSGRIRAFGLGVNECEICEEALECGDFDCFLLAGRYTLLEQDALNTFLPKCAQRNVSVVIGGVYNSGILALGTKTERTLRYNYQPAPQAVIERVRRIEAVCDAFQVPLPAAALQFPLACPAVANVIVGMRSPRNVRRNLKLLSCPIPAELWQALRAEGLLHPAAPVPAGG